MDIFKKTEAMLYNYKNTLAEIKNIRIEIDDIEQEFRGMGAILYDDMPKSHNVASSVEKEVENKEKKIEHLTNVMIRKENEARKIENALEVLNEKEKLFVQERYFEKQTHFKVSEKMGLHEVTMYDYRKKVIEKLSALLFIVKY